MKIESKIPLAEFGALGLGSWVVLHAGSSTASALGGLAFFGFCSLWLRLLSFLFRVPQGWDLLMAAIFLANVFLIGLYGESYFPMGLPYYLRVGLFFGAQSFLVVVAKRVKAGRRRI